MRVLVAEDDPIIALGLASRLRAMGHEVLGPVATVVEARELADGADLYLFDVDLADGDGIELARSLSEDGPRRPVVILTGLDAPEVLDRSIAAGVLAHLTKPVDDRQLEAALRLAAARSAELEALRAEVDSTRQALADRKVVEQAKGLLISGLGLTEPEAFARIQTTARQRNLRLVDVARAIVDQRALYEKGRP
ncbi:ANTAR domain-containing protein [Solirubrobacter sp. CPCC 204708]|uniref:ANTAR domain-containing protein n=1 Tax=Solirubrobacter deserti TaxID=2282478 RepID=A0ABT4RF25_9ACTN|nr:ANTAR domain-containing protein [Solirubrobacter deserti]MBE2318671.1 ANTAR domain-containing protein [Solirubrobacter deserti]MDA0137129.1 ANTAR domain-containing protein [Solirubrobacter deserti]